MNELYLSISHVVLNPKQRPRGNDEKLTSGI